MTRPPKRRDTLARVERAAMRLYFHHDLTTRKWSESWGVFCHACAAHAAVKAKRGKK